MSDNGYGAVTAESTKRPLLWRHCTTKRNDTFPDLIKSPIWTCVCVCVCMCVCPCTRACVCMCVSMCVCACVTCKVLGAALIEADLIFHCKITEIAFPIPASAHICGFLSRSYKLVACPHLFLSEIYSTVNIPLVDHILVTTIQISNM